MVNGSSITDGCFAPPLCVNQVTALSSCYLRFRHTTRYMLVLDDDEFLFLRRRYRTAVNPLLKLIGEIRRRYPPDAPLKAIYTPPTFLFPCGRRAVNDQLFPRLGQHLHSVKGFEHEGKLLMDTEQINVFLVHYITERTHHGNEALFNSDGVHRSDPKTDMAMFHFKNMSNDAHFDLNINPPSVEDYSWRRKIACDMSYNLPKRLDLTGRSSERRTVTQEP